MATPPTVYVETSVVSYLVARPSRDVVVAGHQVITVEWWETRLPRLRGCVSDFVIEEARKGNAEMARARLDALVHLPLLPATSEAERLAEIYVREGLIPLGEPGDAAHLAVATAHGVDYLVTWNCRHLASAVVRRKVAAINTREGHGVPVICTPEELMEF